MKYLLFFFFCFSVQAAEPRKEYTRISGQYVYIFYNTPCPINKDAAGCFWDGRIYVKDEKDKKTLDEEIGHFQLMAHGRSYVRADGVVCDVVTDQGSSKFPVGYEFCRVSK